MKRRPNKSAAGGTTEGNNDLGRDLPAEPRIPVSPGRKWPFRVVAVVVMPLLLLGALEIVLRVSGFGYPTGFFETIHARGGEFLVNNENFSKRFFPPELERSPSPVMLKAKKPASTYRIFVLGESAARGDPEVPYAAARYMEALLDERFPKTHFEVANLGMTAINSHVILPIARDTTRAGGDLWIIYMGNNEMVGPFGAATVFGAKAPPLGFVRLNLAIQKARAGQLLVALGHRLKGRGPNATWGGMKMFVGNQLGADDPRREAVYQNFERNLNDIIRAGLGSGAKIFLNTVAVNLKDCPPFASTANSNLPAANRARFDQLYAEGCSADAKSNFAAASGIFARASELDSQSAELQYRWGKCSLALAEFAAAREHFQRACDVDALPFRADSRINGAVKNAGREFASANLVFFDAAAALENDAPAGICGQETFYEHVHFSFDGNYRLGRAWAEQVGKMLPAEISRNAGASGWASREVCERRLGLTDWNRCAMTKLVADNLRKPPLSGQSNNTERLQSLANDVIGWRRNMNQATAQKAADIYREAIEHSPGDHFVVENFAQFLEAVGDLKQAGGQWRHDCELLPHDCTSYYQAGRLLSAQGQWAEAETALTNALFLRPRLTEAWCVLGNAHLGMGKFDLALDDYQRAAQMDPSSASYQAYVARVLSQLNRHAEAIQRYRQALQLDPDLWEAHFALGDELDAANRTSEAKDEYGEVIRLRPGDALAHLDMGVMQAKLGQYGEALQQFEETLRLDPGNRQARKLVDQLKNRGDHPR